MFANQPIIAANHKLDEPSENSSYTCEILVKYQCCKKY